MPAGAKKLGQCFPTKAVIIVQKIRNAPTRVNRPIKTRMPPISSDKAAAAIHSQAGFMKLKGAGKDIHFSNPGPLKLPNTFWAP